MFTVFSTGMNLSLIVLVCAATRGQDRVNWPLSHIEGRIDQYTWWSVFLSSVPLAIFLVTVINELCCVITQPSLCTPNQ